MTVERKSVDVGRLRLLAEEANREHSQAQRAAGQAVQHAVEAGGLLLKAKEEVGHGNFIKWVEENFEGSERVARKYMRLATAADQNRIDSEKVASLAEAERLLREQDVEQTPGEYEPEVPGEEYDFWDRGAESELQEPEPEAQSPDLDEGDFDFDFDDDDEPEQAQEDEPESASSKKSASREPAPSKKRDVDPLRDAMKAIGRALGAADDEKKVEWAQILRDEIDLYMGSFEEAA